MSEKEKIDALFKGFTKKGYDSNSKINQEELLQYLNDSSNEGKFDQILSNKLFQVLNFDSDKIISIKDFISGYIQFEEDVRINVEQLNKKLKEEQNKYDQLIEKSKKYKEEKMNSEGLSENAKIYGEITDIDIQKKMKSIKEIIIKVIFNDKSEEIHFKMGDMSSGEMNNKKFEFKPTSRKDYFEFIMQGLNNKDEIFEIGRKVFPLTDVDQEEYLVQIVVPEIKNDEKIAAYINAKIILYWNDYKEYEKQKIKIQKKLNKLIIAVNKARDYLKKIREIFGKLSFNDNDNNKLIAYDNYETINSRKKDENNSININITQEEDNQEKNYTLEFNNQKNVKLEVEFNNIKEIKVPETRNQYQSDLNKEEIIQKEEENQEQINQQEINQEEMNQEQINQEQINQEEIIQEEINQEENEGIDMNEYNNKNNINYEENQEENIIKSENKETIERNKELLSSEEAIIRQSINKEITTHNILPQIVQEKVNDVIYDKNVITLPVIYGETKVTYLKEGDALNFDITNLNEEQNNNNNNQISKKENYYEINQKQKDYGTKVKKIDDYAQVTEIQKQIKGEENYMEVISEYDNNFQGESTQEIGYEEYKTTTY